MSNYSHALARLIAEHYDGKQMRLADLVGVPSSLISRHCSGNFRPDLTSLEKICAVVPQEVRGALAAAHLQDELPPSARYLVDVRSSNQEAYELKDALPSVFNRLDTKTQKALENLAQEALENEEAREWLRTTSELFYPKSGSK